MSKNSTNHWFKRKTYGWGWTPATWQGWLTTIIYLIGITLLLLSRERTIPGNPDSGSNFLVFAVPCIVLTLIFVFVAYKTGEKPKWQWGLQNKNNYMIKLTFKIIINAPREKVWHIMLDEDTYMQWTKVFNEGSRYIGTWETGSEIRFIGVDESGKESGGMYSRIDEARPFEFVSIRHLGMITETGEIDTTSDAVKQWSPAFENYTFTEKDGGTEVLVELDMPEEWKDMFTDMWPKALMKLKEIVEQSVK